MIVFCLFVSALCDWNVTKTNSRAHFNVTGKSVSVYSHLQLHRTRAQRVCSRSSDKSKAIGQLVSEAQTLVSLHISCETTQTGTMPRSEQNIGTLNSQDFVQRNQWPKDHRAVWSVVIVGEWGWGVEGKQVGSMDEESQVRGWYNITFICTPTNQPGNSVCFRKDTSKQNI